MGKRDKSQLYLELMENAEELLEMLIEHLYTLILEYIYIDYYKDGSHITLINNICINLNIQFDVFSDFISKKEYCDSVEYDSCYRAGVVNFIGAIREDIEMLKIPKKGEENINIKELYKQLIDSPIPEYLRLENIINRPGWMDIINDYSPEECNYRIIA